MTLRIVGGTDAGDDPAPAVWDDKEEGAARVLREAREAMLDAVIVVGRDCDGDLYVASNMEDGETLIGLLHRGIGQVDRWASQGRQKDEAPPPNEDDGA